MKISIEEIKNAQADQLEVVATNRLSVLQSIQELESIGGSDDYIPSLRTHRQRVPRTVFAASKVQDGIAGTLCFSRKLGRHWWGKRFEETSKGKKTTFKPIVAASPEHEPDDNRQAAPAGRRR